MAVRSWATCHHRGQEHLSAHGSQVILSCINHVPVKHSTWLDRRKLSKGIPLRDSTSGSLDQWCFSTYRISFTSGNPTCLLIDILNNIWATSHSTCQRKWHYFKGASEFVIFAVIDFKKEVCLSWWVCVCGGGCTGATVYLWRWSQELAGFFHLMGCGDQMEIIKFVRSTFASKPSHWPSIFNFSQWKPVFHLTAKTLRNLSTGRKYKAEIDNLKQRAF